MYSCHTHMYSCHTHMYSKHSLMCTVKTVRNVKEGRDRSMREVVRVDLLQQVFQKETRYIPAWTVCVVAAVWRERQKTFHILKRERKRVMAKFIQSDACDRENKLEWAEPTDLSGWQDDTSSHRQDEGQKLEKAKGGDVKFHEFESLIFSPGKFPKL